MPSIANPMSQRAVQVGLPKGNMQQQPMALPMPQPTPATPQGIQQTAMQQVPQMPGWVGNPLAPRGQGPVTSKIPAAKFASLELQRRLKLASSVKFAGPFNSSRANWGLYGLLGGGALGALHHYAIDDDPDKDLLGNTLSGAYMGGLAGYGAGLVKDVYDRQNTFKDTNSVIEAAKAPGKTPNREITTTLKDQIKGYYDGAPGGFDAAVTSAQEAMKDGWLYGLKRWDPNNLTVPQKITLVDRRSLIPTMGGELRGITAGTRPNLGGPKDLQVVVGAPSQGSPDTQSIIEHELTHSNLQTGDTPDARNNSMIQNLNWPVIRPGPKSLRADHTLLPYAGNAEELSAYTAKIKRDWVKAHGQQLDTPQKAEEAIKWWDSKNDDNSENGAIKTIIRATEGDESNKRRLIQQLLQVVGIDPFNKSTKTAYEDATSALKEFGDSPTKDDYQDLESRLRRHYESLGLATQEVDKRVRESLPVKSYWTSKNRDLNKISEDLSRRLKLAGDVRTGQGSLMRRILLRKKIKDDALRNMQECQA